MKLGELVRASDAVRATRSRKEKIGLLAESLRQLSPDELPAGVAYLSGQLPQGKIGVGYAALRELREAVGAPGDGEVSIAEVDRAMTAVAGASGSGSVQEKRDLLGRLMARLGDGERSFLLRLIAGELRQGASEGIVVEAVAGAFALPAKLVRRAHMLSGDLGEVAAAAAGGGEPALRAFDVRLFRPLVPMLAQPADDVEGVFDVMPEAAFEVKLDGARVQLHKSADDVRVYTRKLNDVTAAVPELVELALSLPASELICDGEVIAMRDDGSPQPFQTTMRRFGRRTDISRMRRQLPLSTFLFDALYVDGQSLLDEPTARRAEALEAVVPETARVWRVVTGDPHEAEALFRRAIESGHEGLMAKALDAPYAAGSRGKAWLKLKAAHSLDLVVLAAEWGSGRRKGWLSNLHLGARDPAGGFVMLGKTFKGMTDEVLAWQTTELLARETERDDFTIHVRPELVVEVAFNDVQESPHYPGGMALRFARLKRYRADKTADQADTVDTVRAIFDAGR